MRSSVWCSGLIVLGLASGCGASESASKPAPVQASIAGSESNAPESTPPAGEPTPTQTVQPSADAVAAAPSEPVIPQNWHGVPERTFVQADEIGGDDQSQTYRIDLHGLDFELEARLEGMPEEIEEDQQLASVTTRITLRELGSGHAIEHEWKSVLCTHEFDRAQASMALIGRDADDRRLLELWFTCHYGEDIRSSDSLVLVMLVDQQGGLQILWTGEASSAGSHVCEEWTEIDVEVETRQLVIVHTDKGAIHEPESVPDYDCEDAREYSKVRRRERVALP